MRIHKQTHGLTALAPKLVVKVEPKADLVDLSTIVDALAEHAAWAATALQAAETALPGDDAWQLVNAYALLASELAQDASAILGQTGLRPADLGRLTLKAYAALQRKQAAALQLAASRAKSVRAWLEDNGLLDDDGKLRRVMYDYRTLLASGGRIAKRMAANRVWRERREDKAAPDLSERVRVITMEKVKD